MKPVFDKLEDAIQSRLNVKHYVRKNFIAFRRNSIFTAVRVYTDITADVALPDGDSPPSPFRIAPNYRSEYSRITHVADIAQPQDVSEDLLKWIVRSYENS